MKRMLTAGLSVLAILAGNAIAQQPYERSDTAYPESRSTQASRQPRERQTAPRSYDSHDAYGNSALWGVGG